MEILSPAGSPEALTAAVRTGADAVYLGASAFSARANAQNFDDTALQEAVSYCHARNVKVYLAVNTLLREEELGKALSLVEYACTLPVDAAIVQDLGLIQMLRLCAPELKLNGSTQMSITSPAGARALAKQGLTRVVLARELSLKEIAEIKEKTLDTPIELECFVHGALCMSVSGQCYFSSVLGSRSGNRGLCAQPCRLPFTAPGGTGHDLSLKDLSLIPRLDELAKAGAASAKIEGRMKRPEYVAAATASCRYAADGKPIPPELLDNLSAVFSRSGFTTGYPDGKLGRQMFGVRSKEDVTGATSAVFSQLHTLYKEEARRVLICFTLTVKEGEPVSLTAEDQEGHRSTAFGDLPETALNRPLDQDRCRDQLKKTGGTPYDPTEIRCEIGDNLVMPISALNKLRREALDKLTEQRSRHTPTPFTRCELPRVIHQPKKFQWRAKFRKPETVPELAKQCELIYLPIWAGVDTLCALRDRGFPVAAELPRAIFGTEDLLRSQLRALKDRGITHAWAGTLNGAALAREEGFVVHGGFSLNVFNSPALEWCKEFGLADTELSFELTLAQAAALGGDLPRGLVVYGRLPLMLTRNCPAKNGGTANAADGGQGCRGCTSPPLLRDRRDTDFPILCGGGASEIMNSVPLYLGDRIREVKNQDFGVLNFSVENSVETVEIFRRYLLGQGVEKPKSPITRGLYYRGVD